MSRTDAHRPRAVWIADHPELVHEHHDHRAGSCSLAEGSPPLGWQPERCYLELSWQVRLCACPLCSGHLDRAVERRSQRRAARLLERAAVRGGEEVELEELEARAYQRRF